MTNFNESRAISPSELSELFETLLELRDRTNPFHRGKSAKKKDEDAELAVYNASRLAFGLAGWAYNHIAGRALAPYSNPNRHTHEKVGGEVTYRNFVVNPQKYRAALCALLSATGSMFPNLAGRHLGEAIVALNKGEIRAILRANETDGSRVRPAATAQYKLEAICRCQYLRAQGKTEKDAREEVASAYCRSPATIKTWRERLIRSEGRKKIELEERAARVAGRFAARRSWPGDKLQGKSREWYNWCIRVSLQEAASRLRDSQGDVEVESY